MEWNESEKLKTALLITGGILHTSDAKTAHGLIRGSERFQVIGVVDEAHAGKDAGVMLDGRDRHIPVFPDVENACQALPHIDYCIIGVATVGGYLPPAIKAVVMQCIRKGISVVNGLHDYLNDMPEMLELARQFNVELIDVRRPKNRKDLHFWTGKIFELKTPVVAVIGTDCALGKRTTCRMLRQACEKVGINAQMIYTGQTGWMQGGRFGFIFDSTLNDFIAGEIEHAILSCQEATHPDVIFIEGQSALRNPSGPGGAEFLVSGNAKHVVLVHAPKRTFYEDLPEWGAIPGPESEIQLIQMYGSKVIALALNTEHCSFEEAKSFQQTYESRLGIPVVLPLEEGVEKLVPYVNALTKTTP
ncbi:MAG: DUF1611 domain-containing protein [Saprospiraceae bacterium]|nr:DUF1611 domain-containing protein [Saprospiraceae bacterium]